jgi:hypothetical protein
MNTNKILNNLISTLVVIKTKYSNNFLRYVRVSLTCYDGVPVVKIKHPKIGFLITVFT